MCEWADRNGNRLLLYVSVVIQLDGYQVAVHVAWDLNGGLSLVCAALSYRALWVVADTEIIRLCPVMQGCPDVSFWSPNSWCGWVGLFWFGFGMAPLEPSPVGGKPAGWGVAAGITLQPLAARWRACRLANSSSKEVNFQPLRVPSL